MTDFFENHPALVPGSAQRGAWGTEYLIVLPPLPEGREFKYAKLVLPRGFPAQQRAKIALSKDAVLRIPHVESDGILCIEGDPGPGSDRTAEERIGYLFCAFETRFLQKWVAGDLDHDFDEEPQNYWQIYVGRSRSESDPVRKIWTVDPRPVGARILEGILALPACTVVVPSESNPLASRLLASLGSRAQQQRRVIVADIPIGQDLTPNTWPRNSTDLYRVLKGRLKPELLSAFLDEERGTKKKLHRVVLLRSPNCGFGYLMPGGPSTNIAPGVQRRASRPCTSPLPLLVERLDPQWTEGRDQHPQVDTRQSTHALVLGAGALGSYVVDHLAKAGIGQVTVVDHDSLEPANIGRHLLGAHLIGANKARAVATYVGANHPATNLKPEPLKAEQWLTKVGLRSVDVIVDLTGEPDVRWHVDQARQKSPRPLVIGWMEPYVVAAHACALTSHSAWIRDGCHDLMGVLESVDWPSDVMRHEPGCSSRFQSYTAAAAAYAVPLIVETILGMIDGEIKEPRVYSFVRGQRYLDRSRPGLSFRQWARPAASHDGLRIERPLT